MSVITLRGVLANGAVKSDGSRPLAPYEQPIVWPPGEDGIIKIVVVDSAGALANLTDCSVEFGIKRRGDSEPAVLRLANLIDPINAEADVYLVSADTAGLAGAYFFDAWVRDDAGRHQIVATSNFILPDTAVQPDDLPDAAPPIPPIMNGSVDTVNTTGVTLSSIDASKLHPGFLMYVIAKDAYYRIRVGLGLSVDHDTTETAFGLTGGQWQQLTIQPTIPPAIDTVNTTGVKLSTVVATGFLPGYSLWVTETKSYWHIEINGNGGGQYTVDSNHINALGLTNGQWVNASSAAGVSGVVTMSFQAAGENTSFNTVGEEDVLDVARYFDFDDMPVAHILARLLCAVKVSGGTGTYSVRMGGTLGLADGTIIAQGTTTATTYTPANFVAATFVPPSGLKLLQVTFKNGTVGQTAFIRGAMLALVPSAT